MTRSEEAIDNERRKRDHDQRVYEASQKVSAFYGKELGGDFTLLLEAIAAEVRTWAGLGVTHLGLWLGTTDPDELTKRAEAFAREVAPLV